jgi:diadenosine hexaphosphate hydrolase (ATP-forming)
MTPKKHAAGAVVYRRTPEGPRFLVIYDAYGHWTFPKGHLEADEASAAAARREVAEETGVNGHLGPLVHSIFYPVVKKGVTYDKQVDWYLLEADTDRVVLQAEEGITAYQWETAAEVQALLGYPQLDVVFAKARAILGV